MIVRLLETLRAVPTPPALGAVTAPLAAASQARAGDGSSVPSVAALGLVVALALAAWTASGWFRQADAPPPERASALDPARRWWVSAIVAAALVALALSARQESGALLVVVLAVGLAVSARLAWRAVVAAQRGDGRSGARIVLGGLTASLGAPAGLLVDGPARDGRSGRQAGREGIERTVASTASLDGDATGHGPPPAARPAVSPSGTPGAPGVDRDPVPDSGRVLDALRSCMDEVSYRPGSPNVLTMTKYLRDAAGEPVARSGEGSGPALVPAEEEPRARLSRSDEGDETVLGISGVLDALTVADVRPAVDAVLAERRTRVTVDLSSLRRIDSSGVGAVVGLYKRCRALGGTVRITGLQGQPLAVFRLLRLDRVFALP
jgi:anti-sigma B factor antagonist